MKKISIKIRTLSTCPARKRTLEALDSLESGFLPVPILFEKKTDKFLFYVESIEKENKLGDLKDAPDEVVQALDAILNEQGKGDIALSGYDGNLVDATLEYTAFEKTEIKVNASVFEELIKKLASEKIATKEEAEESIVYMRSHRFPDELIRKCMETWTSYDVPLKKPETAYVDTEPKSKRASILAKASVEMLCGHHVLFEGDKSVGKNMAAESLAYFVFRMPFRMQTMGPSMTGDEFFGTKSTDNTAASMIDKKMALAAILAPQGKGNRSDDEWNAILTSARDYSFWSAKAASIQIVQELTVLVEAMEKGMIYCANEANLVNAATFSGVFNPILDGSGEIIVPGKGILKIHPKFRFIGTQNADYTGTFEQNDATTSRLACIQFPYPDSIKKQLLAASKVDLDDAYFTQADNLYKGYLSAVKKGQAEKCCLNIRGMVRALQSVALIPGFVKLADEIEMQVINTCPTDDRPVLMAQLKETVTL